MTENYVKISNELRVLKENNDFFFNDIIKMFEDLLKFSPPPQKHVALVHKMLTSYGEIKKRIEDSSSEVMKKIFLEHVRKSRIWDTR